MFNGNHIELTGGVQQKNNSDMAELLIDAMLRAIWRGDAESATVFAETLAHHSDRLPCFNVELWR